MSDKKFYLDSGSSLNIRNEPLTKDWKERFSLSADVTPQEIYQVVEPGDSIRIINHTIEYDNTVPDVSDFLPGRVPFGERIAEDRGRRYRGDQWEIWNEVIQRLLDSVEKLNEKAGKQQFHLSVFREFVDRDWDREGYTVAQVYPSP